METGANMGAGQNSIDGPITPREVKTWTQGKFEVVDTKLKSLGRSLDDVRRTATEASKRSNNALSLADDANSNFVNAKHECLHSSTLTNIKADVNSWTNWWKKTMFVVVAATVIGAGALVTWLVMFNNMDNHMKSFDEKFIETDKKIGTIVKNQEELKRAEEVRKKTEEKNKEIRKEELKEALHEVLIDFSPSKKKRK